MALTITTIENTTTVTGTGGPTTVFTPSAAEVGRYRIRVVRWTNAAGAAADTVKIEGVSPKPSDGTAETQTLWQSFATAANFTDSTSFPDECEFRGKVQITVASTGTPTVILYHG